MNEYRLDSECPWCQHQLDDPRWHDSRVLVEHFFQYLTVKRRTVECPLDGWIVSDADHPHGQLAKCADVFLHQEARRLYERELRRAKA